MRKSIAKPKKQFDDGSMKLQIQAIKGNGFESLLSKKDLSFSVKIAHVGVKKKRNEPNAKHNEPLKSVKNKNDCNEKLNKSVRLLLL
jgi:hypothetical protein